MVSNLSCSTTRGRFRCSCHGGVDELSRPGSSVSCLFCKHYCIWNKTSIDIAFYILKLTKHWREVTIIIFCPFVTFVYTTWVQYIGVVYIFQTLHHIHMRKRREREKRSKERRVDLYTEREHIMIHAYKNMCIKYRGIVNISVYMYLHRERPLKYRI